MSSTKHTFRELELIANELRTDVMEMGPRSGISMHVGPAYSMAEILTVLYCEIMNVRPDEPRWPERDRLVVSKGHAAPIVYAMLARLGYFDREVLWDCKHTDNILQGHPCLQRTPGIDMTSGSLGNGLSSSLGMALGLKERGSRANVFCILGDGELQEGMTMEAMMAAPARGADNLTAIVDYNHHQSSGSVEDIMPLHPLAEKWESFGWRVFEVDGHSIPELCSRLSAAVNYEGRPAVIIAHTVKGRGVSFIEHNNAWHVKMPTPEEYRQAMTELGAEHERLSGVPAEEPAPFEEVYRPFRPRIVPAREIVFDRGPIAALREVVLEEAERDEKLTVATGDAVGSMGFGDFEKRYSHRIYNLGIAEQDSVGVAAGLASTGLNVIQAGFAPFMTMRSLEQFRTFIAYPQLNVMVAGAMGGISVGLGGPTHQSYEDYGIMRMIPNTLVAVPCDYASAKAVVRALIRHEGPSYVRLGMGPQEKIYEDGEVEFVPGRADVLMDGTDVTVITCGGITANVMTAARRLSAEGMSLRVLNMMSIKPIDRQAILDAARETGAIAVVEEHQRMGGLGAAVAEIVSEECPVPMKIVGFADTFARTGDYYELLDAYHLGVADIEEAVRGLAARKKKA